MDGRLIEQERKKITADDLQVGGIYGNGKGLYRKIRKLSYPHHVDWVRCTDTGAVSAYVKVQTSGVSSFVKWAKERKHDPHVGQGA